MSIELVMRKASQLQPELDWVLGLGVVLLIAGATGCWAGVHLRGKTHERLRKPVEIAYHGLTDRAVDSLRELKDHLDELLPDFDVPFDPLSLIVDPSTVERSAKDSIRILKERQKIHSQFNSLLQVCSLLMWLAGIFTVLVFTSTMLYFFAYPNIHIWKMSCYITGATFALIVALFITYSILQTRIQGSIEHANPIALPEKVTSR